jgi:hypothetical protein
MLQGIQPPPVFTGQDTQVVVCAGVGGAQGQGLAVE